MELQRVFQKVCLVREEPRKRGGISAIHNSKKKSSIIPPMSSERYRARIPSLLPKDVYLLSVYTVLSLFYFLS